MGQLLSLLCFSFVILGLVLVCMSCILLSYSLLARLIVHQLIRFLSSVYFSSFMFLLLCFGFPFFSTCATLSVQLTSVFLHSILLSMVSATMHPNHSSSSPFHFSWLLIIFTVQLYRHKVHIQCHLLESFVVGVAVTL